MIQAISSNAALGQASGPASSAGTAGYIYYDPKDTNRDGIVSYAEELDWAFRHPGEVSYAQAVNTAADAGRSTVYNQKGDLDSGAGVTRSQINLYI